jgi:hypothetical protein
MSFVRGGSRIARHAAAVAVGLSIASAPAGAADDSSAAGTFETKKACVAWHEQAQILRRASSLVEARADLLACSQDVCPVAVRSDCAQWLADVAGAIPSVVVRARSAGLDESSVRVFVDATLAKSHLDGRALELDPGLHTFRFEADGESPAEERVLIVEGEKNRILTIPFGVPSGVPGRAPSAGAAGADGSAAPGAPRPRPIPKLDYVLAGGALVAAGASAGFGIWGLEAKSSLDSSCRPVCTSAQIASVRTKLVVADALLGGSLVSAGATVYVYVTRPEIALPGAPASAALGTARSWARVTMGAGATGPSLGLEGAF